MKVPIFNEHVLISTTKNHILISFPWLINQLPWKKGSISYLDHSTVNYMFFQRYICMMQKNCHIVSSLFPLLHVANFSVQRVPPPIFCSQTVFFFQRYIKGLLQQTLILKRFQGTLLLFTLRRADVFFLFLRQHGQGVGDERCFFLGCRDFFLKEVRVCGIYKWRSCFF